MAARHPIVKEVRGAGLMWGLELTRDAAPVVPAGLERGVIVNRTAETRRPAAAAARHHRRRRSTKRSIGWMRRSAPWRRTEDTRMTTASDHAAQRRTIGRTPSCTR